MSQRSSSAFFRLGRAAAGAGFLAAALLLPSPAVLSAAPDLPDLGDPAATVLSPEEEAQLGRRFMRAARQKLTFVTDPELDEFVRRLGNRLALAISPEEPQYRFYLIRSPDLNAFAVPGGHIAVHTGLVLAAKTEDELASVLAHEIAHLEQHHMARMVAQAKSLSVPAIAAIVAGVLLGGQAGAAAIVATNAALADTQLRYSRDFEREADRIGMQYLAEAGYDPASMPAFFEKLQQSTRVQEGNAPEFLRTHPLTSDRIAEAQARAESLAAAAPPGSGKDKKDKDVEFHLIRMKIRALYAEPAQDLLRELEGNSPNHTPEVARYGKAVLLARLGRHEESRREWDALFQSAPARLAHLVGRVQTEILAHDYRRAIDYLLAAERQHSGNPVLGLYLTDTLLKAGRPQEARDRLRALMKRDPGNPLLHQMLARAEGDSGNLLGMHRHLAEYHYLNGNTSEALRQLRLAKRYTGDSYYENASLEARTAEIEAEARESAREEKARPPERPEPKRRRWFQPGSSAKGVTGRSQGQSGFNSHAFLA